MNRTIKLSEPATEFLLEGVKTLLAVSEDNEEWEECAQWRDVIAILIKASPESGDLYAACQAALRLLRHSGFTENTATVMQLKLAIARTQGE